MLISNACNVLDDICAELLSFIGKYGKLYINADICVFMHEYNGVNE